MSRRPYALATLTAVVLVAATPAVVAAPAPNGGGGAAPGDTPSGRDRGVETPPDTGTALAPLGLQLSELRQAGSDLRWNTTTNAAWSPASLRRAGQSLCLRLVYADKGVNSRDVCVRRRGAKATLTLQRVLTSGGHGPLHELRASIVRHSKRELSATFSPATIGIPSGAAVRWRTLASTDGCDVGGRSDCFRALPKSGAVLQLRAPVPYACTPAGPAYVTNGSRSRKVVALTFDDGPSPYTTGFLDVLRAKGVKGTFFQIGQQVSSYPTVEKRILAEGHELANHTWSHATVSGGGSLATSQISSTTNAIQTVSGFKPCAFRAPGGAISSSLVSLARGLGYSTIEWDVDPQDWRTPGTDAIYSRIVSAARSGSIILMHDGGGNRSQTLAALPRVIDTLRARGYGFVTIHEMTGARLLYR
ncbi:polysaccharide deacetylase family protein [Conexibacter sp. JD483]|uniref:polysaccharide deacetylase family protein n=1 Tax=unclassified Conexibacter TaxID=2627773 RepID=UPI00271EFBED|nr:MULTISPECIES: polysaccharide deacetylase family protein [unclassified Conexibacter]MDO8184140.1 polysaccharide deacetylase family protein [Conexibacter sp. CPCC 205706]MDO8197132.1 polysaccharide deacetylase family protein [Conexibacter sp. CPCC 205762]MDR9367553.1 polysaccharide deacetylase family protein [Conexibacter sp. JD483]